MREFIIFFFIQFFFFAHFFFFYDVYVLYRYIYIIFAVLPVLKFKKKAEAKMPNKIRRKKLYLLRKIEIVAGFSINSGKSKWLSGKIWPKGLPVSKFFQVIRRTFHCFSDVWIIAKMMWPRVALGLTVIIFWFNLGTSLTVLNPDFTRVIRKSIKRAA